MNATDLRLPQDCLGRLDSAIEDMAREDAKPMRSRDSRVYSYAYGVIETFGLMLAVSDPSDPAAVREALAKVATII